MMTKTMALELAKDNMRANIVAPGAIETDINLELRDNKVELKFSGKYVWDSCNRR
jgi:glucose 1-dehydrogenase